MKFMTKFKGVIAFYAVIALTAYGLVVRSNDITSFDVQEDNRIVINDN